MKQTIKPAIIGGSGKAGIYLVQHFIQQQQSVRLLLRHPETFNLESPYLDIVRGDVREPADLKILLAGCDALLSTLGQPRDSSEPIFPQATRNILEGLANAGIRRYVAVTGLSIDVPGDQKSEKTTQLSAMMRRMFPDIIAAKQEEYRLLSESKIDWTLLRLPMIRQTTAQFQVAMSNEDCKGESISAADLASCMEAQLKDRHYLRQAPFLYNV